MRIGFIGLGLMGSPMAKNILKAGFPLTVYNRTPSKTKELEKLGAKVAKTPKEVAQQAQVIITMVTAGKDVEQVLFGKLGVVYGVKKNLIIIDMSTIGPTAAKKIAKKLAQHNIEFIDAPVTGSVPKATTGELTMFIGAKEGIYKKVKKLLLSMGKNLHYMGPVGSGQGIKIINNQILALTIEAIAEGMLLADYVGLPRKKVIEVLQTVPAVSPMMSLKLPNYAQNKFPLLFSMTNMKKDLMLAVKEVKKGQKKLPILEHNAKLFTKAIKGDLAKEDFSAIIKILEKI
jgi:3-hydroxyisobutyrate dehydrogenase